MRRALAIVLLLAACDRPPPTSPAQYVPPAEPPAEPAPEPVPAPQPDPEPACSGVPCASSCCLGACCQGTCCVGGRCDDAGLCAVAPPPPPDPDPGPQLVAHVNELAGIAFTYYSYQPLDTHDGWSALQAVEAWSASATETTWNVCSYSGCYCRLRAGTDLVATICPDPAYCQGCTDILAGGYATVTATTRETGYPRCLAADLNCPVPSNPSRVPWH